MKRILPLLSLSLSICISISIAGVAGTAAAQPNPTFSYGNAADVKDLKSVEWTATAEAGLIVTTGNARTTSVAATARAARVDPQNKLEAQLSLTYARATIRSAADADGSGAIEAGEFVENATTTANAWQGKLRYDRFLTSSNSLYIAALASADRPAGKDLVGGGQAGYSRRLFKDEHHEVVAELGYDFSYEDLAVGDPLSIHSARAFAGYKGTIDDKTAVEGSLEVLTNLNTLATLPEESSALEDTRLNAGAAVTTKITDDISLSVSVAARYDTRPAPLPPFGGLPFAVGFTPVADELDTITKATLIISLF
jgi:putative salt-induced outer membrane protein YdiY